jgi:integrase/recombinase XerD
MGETHAPDSQNAPQNATSAQLSAFLAYMAQERRLADNSLATYRYAVHSYLAHLTGLGIGPGQATKEIFLTYLEHRKRQGRAAGTLFQDVLATRHFHRYLLREGIAKDDPTAGIRLPTLKNRLPQPLSRAEMEKLLEAPKGKRFQNVRDKAILELFYATGLRVSELLGLRTGQVDLAVGNLRVIGKRNKERLVPFGTRAAEAIRKYLALRAERYPDASEPLFIGQHGRKISGGHLWAQLKIYAKRRE